MLVDCQMLMRYELLYTCAENSYSPHKGSVRRYSLTHTHTHNNLIAHTHTQIYFTSNWWQRVSQVYVSHYFSWRGQGNYGWHFDKCLVEWRSTVSAWEIYANLPSWSADEQPLHRTTAITEREREIDRAREKGMSGWGSKHGRDVRDVDGCEEMSAGK